ncbi:MAG TPA: DUF5009 domain-containing protein, partial [Bryobacteraceae bacterium]|nr:DUF5009 domain-containing protein [Bryobacteraceae bacterium]
MQPGTATVKSPPSPVVSTGRLVSIDVLRGLVMFLMLAEALELPFIAKQFPANPVWSFIGFHTSHVTWEGCSLHDLIQPGFSFLVGAALAFSIAKRTSQGQSFQRMLGHAVWRAAALVVLGVALRFYNRHYVTLEDTLAQIGLGYVPLFLLGWASARARWVALVAILVGYWAAFALYPLPGPGFDYAAVGVPADWGHFYQGFLAHWNKNSNFAWAFDTWFLNLFPRPTPFLYNDGGYSTLSFIPTLGTMLMGLLAGDFLRSSAGSKERQIGVLLVAGAVSIGLALLLDRLGICPIVKRIWTPAFTLFSGGWILWMLAGLHYIT